LFLRRKRETAPIVQVPILCKFWEDDDVWNGAAVDLPIAVFGDTFEEAQRHLREGIVCHLQALQELHQLAPAIEYLQQRARDYTVSVEEIPANKPLLRIDATVQNDRVCAASV